jgi:gliding motility-associated-like protein
MSYFTPFMASPAVSLRIIILVGMFSVFLSGTLQAKGHILPDGPSIAGIKDIQKLNACTPPVTSQVPSANLMARYPFNGNMNDVSGSANHGLPQVAPTLTSDRFSVPNSAYAFDGVSQWSTTTNVIAGPNIFSIGLWFKTTSTAGGGLMGFCESQTTTGFTNRDRVIYMNNVGQLEFGLFPGSIQAIKTPESYNDGFWHFGVATLSASGMKLYVDGILKVTNPSITTGQSMNGYWRLGHFDLSTGWSTASSLYFNGTLDDVFYYNRELSVAEVQNLYEIPDGAGSDSPKCAGETLNLKGVSIAGASYSWTGPNSFTSNVQNPSIFNITAANQGIYYLTITDASACSTAPIPVLVRVATVSVPLSMAPAAGQLTKYLYNGNANDLSGNSNHGILQNGPLSVPGRFGIANAAYSLNGTNQYISTTNAFSNPSVFTVAVWFKTTTTAGGKIMGFGNNQTGASTTCDRHIYMTDKGQLVFGVNNGSIKTINSGGEIYNDGQWHYVIGVLSGTGMKLYVDGVLLSQDATVTSAGNYSGYWRLGYDDIPNTWPSAPTSKYFNGQLDDTYIYDTEIPASSLAQYKITDGATSNEPFCATGGTLNFTSNSLGSAYSYYWTGPNGFTSIVQNPSISGITAANAGIYTLTVTTTSSCPARAYVNVRIDNVPSAPSTTGNSRCDAGIVSLSATGSPLKYRWYAASAGGTSLEGASTYSPNVSVTTPFYVSSVSPAGCESASRTPVTATVNVLPPSPTAGNVARCGPGTVTLTASGSPSGYKWYDASTGGVLLGSGASYSPSITTTTTFYVSSVSAAACESAARTAVIATMNALPSAPTSSNVSRCDVGTVTLNASGSPSGYNWYDASAGGFLLGSGPSYSTSITTTTTFYVSSVSAAVCESAARTAVIATMNALPASPTSPNVSRCDVGTVTLTATGSPSVYNWYDASAGGVLLGSGATYTPFITTTTTFYVSSVSAGCESAARTAVVATMNALPVAPTSSNVSRCDVGTITLTASGSPSGYKWYDASTGGALLGSGATYSTSITTTTTYYVSSVSAATCESAARTPVIATMNALPASPSSSNVARCGAGTVTLTATGSPSGYNWYDALTVGTFLGSGATYSSTIAGTTTFYVSSVSAAGCESSARTSVTATVDPIPPVPSITNGSRCGPGTINLTASGSPFGYRWYDVPSGGIPNGTGPGFNPFISATDTFYIASVSAAGCESATRGMLIATVNVLPSSPIAANIARCGAGTVTLTATGSPSGYNWYDAASGGTLLGPGAVYSPSITGTTTFYVSSVSAAACESAARTAVVATMDALPPSASAANVQICGPGTVTITASGSPSGYKWYDASGSLLGTGASYSSFISDTTTFYVSAVSAAGCESAARTAGIAIVDTLPAPPDVSAEKVCGAGVSLLTAGGPAINYKWYGVSAGGPVLATGPFYSPSVSVNTDYFVSSISTAGCESASRTKVTALVIPIPAIPSAKGDTVCVSGTVNLTATGSGPGFRWYDSMTGDNLLDSTATYSPSISANTVYYVCSVDNNCESSRIPVIAAVSSMTVAGIFGSAQTVCYGNNTGLLQLNGYTGSIKKWEISADAFAADINNLGNTADQYQFTDLTQTSSYRVTVQSGVCPAITSVPVTITVNGMIPANPGLLTGDTIVPSGFNSGTISLSGYIGTIVRWESSVNNFSTSPSVINSSAPDLSYNNLTLTTSYRAVVQSGVCPEKISAPVTVVVENPLALIPDTMYTSMNKPCTSWTSVLSNDVIGQFFKLMPISLFTTPLGGSFEMDSNGNFVYTPAAGFIGMDKIAYSVCDKASGTNCLSSEIVIIVKDTVIIYSSLTPNGDGINDAWIIDGINYYTENNVKIINRWGDLVYQQSNYNNQDKVWKGECNSGFVIADKRLPDGTYFYSIDLSNGSKPLTGYVVIKQ